MQQVSLDFRTYLLHINEVHLHFQAYLWNKNLTDCQVGESEDLLSPVGPQAWANWGQ